MRWRRTAAVVTAVLVAGLTAACGPSFEGLHLRIAAGAVGGVYNNLARPLASAWAADLGIEAPEVMATQGSRDNINRVLSGGADVAFVAADLAAESAQQHPGQLTALARIHDDYLHIVVRADSPYTSVSMLKGRHIAVGSPESGVEYIANRVLAVAGLSNAVSVQQLGLDDSLKALENRQVDALFWSGGLPTPLITQYTQKVGLRLLDMASLMEGMQAYSPVYGTATIPGSTYNQAGPVTTLVVPNFLVVPTKMSADVAEALTRGLYDSRPALARANRAALSIDVHPGIETEPLPLHPGALTYYRSLKI
ncbi:TAXI family TRAP transporter solute-binding subunit [Amycolatopsis rhabdoformis]|uniref:TAXI family TRAP transporter solute-binding subunit n=1 Tax=Amycolatopsis rhabdoformis TaxID=1448059 RepID=A0ABZ1I8M7_9PSEU|nr:TAXI family TRAP transporter solute-binding subunit [Amycolatopsis rhabdoformis]WSE30725.1 TAXI family TRAP transporter solute-binding subunit [Amycolatopsis rhabdoformis]